MSEPGATSTATPRRGGLRRTWRKASVLVSVFYAYMLEYRAEIFLWAISGVLPLVLMGLWMRAARETDMGLAPVDFARYFFAVFIIGQFTTVWVIWEFEYDIVEGRLSPYLLQPMDPVFRHLAQHAGERLTRLPFVFGFIVLFFVVYPQGLWWPGWVNALYGVVAVAMAFTLRFVMQYTVAMLGFWTERASALESLTFLCFMFLSGRIAPLAVYPEAVATFARFTPFPYVVDFPASVVLGVETNIWPRFAAMTAWIVALLAVNRILWYRGLRQYSGMGA